MTQKNMAISLALIIFCMPAFVFTMNKIFFSKFNKLPQELFEVDKPLFSFMYLTKNRSEKTSRYGFYLKQFGKQYTTNAMGLRLPKVNLNQKVKWVK